MSIRPQECIDIECLAHEDNQNSKINQHEKRIFRNCNVTLKYLEVTA